MDKGELFEILEDWNFWKEGLEAGIERKGYLEKCMSFLKTNVIVSIIGVRRAGKSYIMRQIIKRMMESGTPKEDILMVNLEDERFTEFYPKLLDEIYETYSEFLKPGKKPVILLDEIHNMPRWEKWVRTMQELGKAKIIVSGSSSKLMSGELATVLTGRHLDMFVFPLGFEEFLRFNNLEIESKLDAVSKKTEIMRLFNQYLEFGGFPEVVSSKDKKQLLLTYFEDVITKDIEKRYDVKEKEKLRTLSRFYLTNISSPVTFNSLRKHLSTTTNTIERFSSFLEETNMIFFVKRFSFKTKEQEKAARKVYSIDVGLSNAVGFRFSSNAGKVAENVVAVALKRMQSFDPNTEIYYWQDSRKKEVDFVLKHVSGVKSLVQVCWNVEEYRTKEREIKALIKASNELRCSDLLVITGGFESEEKIRGKTIRYIPLWKWLLENDL